MAGAVVVPFARAYLEELRGRVPLRELISHYGVKLVRQGQRQLGLCPFHQEQTPSFNVWPDHFHCFGCGAHGDAITFLMRFENLNFQAAVSELQKQEARRCASITKTPQQRMLQTRGATENAAIANSVFARRIWESARDPVESPVEQYLALRGLTLPPEPVLRWSPTCPDGRTLVPAMIARVDHVDRGFVAVSRTFLVPDRKKGEWHKRSQHDRAFLGPVGGGAVQLARPAPGAPLVISEGIETALSVMVATGVPAWAALSADGITKLVLPPEVREIIIFADNDGATATGELGARVARGRWVREGRRVAIEIPPDPETDANDMLLGV